jgi:lysophospholipase L1-like esterase
MTSSTVVPPMRARVSRAWWLLLAVCGACSSPPGEPGPRAPVTAEAAPPIGDGGPPIDAAVGPTDALDLALPSPPPPTTASWLTVPPGSLDRFYAALARAERRDANGRVLISMFGDSHTAGDQLPGVIRRTLGARFGQGGRGVVLPGRPPVRHYYAREVAYGSDGKWQAALGGSRDAVGPFGMTGVRTFADKKTAQAWVESCRSCAMDTVDRFDVFYLRTRGTGQLAFQVDSGRWQKVPTRLAATAPVERQVSVLSVPARAGRHRLNLRPAGGGPVQLFAVALERSGPGVVVDGLGVTGRRLGHLRTWDWDDVLGPQLTARAPSLIVLQYGTNEADDASIDLAALARLYDEIIALCRSWAPDADILVLGPPDLNKRAAGKACDKRKPARDPLAPVPPECEWHTPPTLPAVVEVQRAAAARNQVAFYDTLAAFGGVERMDSMLHLDPPLAFTDHVHLTAAGYDRWARGLLDALLVGYDAWRPTAPAPTAPTPTAP